MNTLLKFIISLVTACFTFNITPIQAQVGEARNDIAIGINGGVTLSSVTFTPTIKQGNLMGMIGGITLRYTCEKYFKSICALQVELNFSQRGWKEDIEDGSGNTYERTLNYLEVPFLMNMGWGKEQRGVKFFICAGPQFNFYLGGTEVYGGEGVWDTSQRPNNVDEQYGKEIENTFDYGITGGGGLDLATSIGHFILEARYYYGLADIFSNSKKDYFGRSGNSSVIVKFSYLFDIIKTKQ